MVISLILPMQQASAADVISVSEAIANNNGTATVEGYIVGIVKAKNSIQHQGPFSTDTNIAIADTPNETDTAKILPVQLPSGNVRTELNLKANPENLGMKIQITGSLELYFSMPGHKSATSFSFVDAAPPEPQVEEVKASVEGQVVSKGTQVTLSSATPDAAIYYTVDGSNPTADSTLYTAPITINEDVTLKAIAVKEGLKNSSIAEFKYQVALSGLRIHDIQGAGHDSPVANKVVEGVEGIVTKVVDDRNFYMQDLQPDNNSNTSEGILIYQPNHGQTEGNVVSVNGQVKEWVLEGYSDKLKTDLAMTEINAQFGSISILEEHHVLPSALIIGMFGLQPPTKVIDNDKFAEFDPQEDGIDFYESLEGMLVEINNPTVIAPQKYGELVVLPDRGEYSRLNSAGGLNITEFDYNPERIFVDMGDESFVAKSGDYFEGAITGVVSYGFSNYKVLTDAEDLPVFVEGNTEPETTRIHEKHKELTIASFNVENFSANENGTSDEKVSRIAGSIVNNLKSPDIVGLVEMQDGNGSTNDGTTDAKESADRLIAEITAQGGPEYVYTDIAPENNQDGGQPGGNIRVGFIYNPERVSLAEGTKGTATEAVDYENGKLTLNPGRIDPMNPAFDDSRKPVAAQFEFNGEDVIVVANHFNSKGGDQPLFGKNQPPVLGSEVQRKEIAAIVNDFVKDVKEEDKNAKVVLLGDFNDFEFTDSLEILKGNELTNMIEKVPFNERYTYSYQGNAQVLDHILVTNNMAKKTKVDIVHINSQFMEEHGRASDHDPVLIQVKLDKVK
ncbi:endonuclease [Fictibacillus arsenicus]|uniref:Endonuclease n=2 Tax=Fictibacillus arsenicus TaxID=255247 RepID=A0A1V3G9N6_9BACL|nr:endonuclease [Fictibacillus arsenicus]